MQYAIVLECIHEKLPSVCTSMWSLDLSECKYLVMKLPFSIDPMSGDGEIRVKCLRRAGIKGKWDKALKVLELFSQQSFHPQGLGVNLICNSLTVGNIPRNHVGLLIQKKSPEGIFLDKLKCLKIVSLWISKCSVNLLDRPRRQAGRCETEDPLVTMSIEAWNVRRVQGSFVRSRVWWLSWWECNDSQAWCHFVRTVCDSS